jgi:hypothetical protein
LQPIKIHDTQQFSLWWWHDIPDDGHLRSKGFWIRSSGLWRRVGRSLYEDRNRRCYWQLTRPVDPQQPKRDQTTPFSTVWKRNFNVVPTKNSLRQMSFSENSSAM